MAKLNDEKRAEVLERISDIYCRHCGRNHEKNVRYCQRSNDE